MQTRFFRNVLRIAAPVALFAALMPAVRGSAQAATATPEPDHVVPSQALQQQVEATSAARQKNIEILKEFVSTPTAAKAMQSAHVDPLQVKTAIPTLSNEDLSSLAARATTAQQEFAAGHIGPSLFTLLVLAIILLIIVIVIH